MMKYALPIVAVASFIFFIPAITRAIPPERQYYEIRIYHLGTAAQEKRIDLYLRNALIPALHKNNVFNIGVFKALSNDTAAIRDVYVVIPFRSLDQSVAVNEKIVRDKAYQSDGADYIDAAFDNPPYIRIEKIFSKAFQGMPAIDPVKLNSPFSDRVYELRSYESATEKLHEKKVKMFNEGNEIALFKRLGFHPVFFSQALSGAALPNLVYMISFDSMTAHDQLWDQFRSDPEWKKLSSMDEYKNAMYKANSYLLRPADYSDY